MSLALLHVQTWLAYALKPAALSLCAAHIFGSVAGLDHGIGHLASMGPHQRLKRVRDLVILSHDDEKARD